MNIAWKIADPSGATGDWRLATGGWLLAAGDWQLVAGGWRMNSLQL